MEQKEKRVKRDDNVFNDDERSVLYSQIVPIYQKSKIYNSNNFIEFLLT